MSQGKQALHCPATSMPDAPGYRTLVVVSTTKSSLSARHSQRMCSSSRPHTSNWGPLQGEHSTLKVMWPQSGLSREGLASSTCSQGVKHVQQRLSCKWQYHVTRVFRACMTCLDTNYDVCATKPQVSRSTGLLEIASVKHQRPKVCAASAVRSDVLLETLPAESDLCY